MKKEFTGRILAVVVALLFSVANSLLGPAVKTQTFTLNSDQITRFAVSCVVYSVLNIILYYVANRIQLSNHYKVNDKIHKKEFIYTWIFIFVLWLPAYIIMYPGVLSYDMMSQVFSAMGTIVNNHHPILHTWLIRVFMKFGKNVLNSYEAGLGLLSFLQMVILSYALTRLAMTLKKRGVPRFLVILTIVMSGLWFMNACLSVTMVKDTLHAAFLVLFVCHFIDLVIAPYQYMKEKINYFCFPIIVFLMCALRNNGLHIYLFCFVFLAVLRIRDFKRVRIFAPLVIMVILPVIVFKVYTGPVFRVLNIEQGQVREALSLPIQQLQSVAIHKAEELTDEQTAKLNYYIDNLAWRAWSPVREYDPFFADPAKSCFYSDNYNENPVAFWKFYFQIGKQYTKEYIKAALSNTIGYWYPGYYEFSYVECNNYPAENFVVPLKRRSLLNLKYIENYFESLCRNELWRKLPVIRLFFVSGFAPWILALAIVLAWRRQHFFTRVAPLFLPLIAQYGIMLLSPMSSFRYSWPLFVMFPVIFIILFGDINNLPREDIS